MSFTITSFLETVKQRLPSSDNSFSRKANSFLGFLLNLKKSENTAVVHFSTKANGQLTKAENTAAAQFGSPKADGKSVGGMHPDYVLSRILMRHPNAAVRCNMELLHAQIKDKFGKMSDSSLDWLLGGSRKTSRGGFRTVQEFRQFLAMPVEKIPSSHLISNLASILAAIGHRYDRVDWVEPPFHPGKKHAAIAKVIDGIMEQESVPYIGTVFRDKPKDMMQGTHSPNTADFFTVKSRRMSNASLLDEDSPSKQPLYPTSSQTFRKYNSQGQLSWAGKAYKQGVRMRAHFSGTTPRVCAAIQGLLRCPNGDHLLNENDARELYSAILIPHLFRSDYHSIAETQIGIDYYIEQYKNKNQKNKKQIVPPSPTHAFELGVSAMLKSVRNTRRSGEETSPQQAAATLLGKKIVPPSIEKSSVEVRARTLKAYLKLNDLSAEARESAPAPHHRKLAVWPKSNGQIGVFIPSKNSHKNQKNLSDTTGKYLAAKDFVEAKKIILDSLHK